MTTDRRFVICLAVVWSVSCGGGSGSGSGSPTAPTATINLSVGSINAVAERTTSGLRYRVTFQLRESSGTTGATVNAVRLDFAQGGTSIGGLTISNPLQTMQITAGGTVDSREIVVDDSGSSPPDRVTVRVDYTADRGGSGSITGSGNVTAPGTPPPSTPPPTSASCFVANGPPSLCVTMSPITVSCRTLPNRFEQECSATLPMVVHTAITSGVITVGIHGYGVSARDFMTTINIIPNTAPGAMTVQIPTRRMGAGCGTSGVRSDLVNIFDGPYDPPHRVLFATGVQSTVTCN